MRRSLPAVQRPLGTRTVGVAFLPGGGGAYGNAVQVQARGANNRQEVAQVAGVSCAPTGRRRATQRANAWRWNASYLVSWRDRPALESAPAGRPPALSRGVAWIGGKTIAQM
jgi:hypothetical protein